MPTPEELEQRISAIEAREAADITDLKKHIATLERWKGDSHTTLGKLWPIMEATRLRVSAVEFAVEGFGARWRR